MIDKVQKIREEVERLKGWNNNVRNSTLHMTLQEEDFNRGKHSSYLEILDFINSLQEEPASDDLEKEIKNYFEDWYDGGAAEYGGQATKPNCYFATVEDCKNIARHFANWQKQQDKETIELAEDHAMLAGMEKMKQQMIEKAIPADVMFDYYDDKDRLNVSILATDVLADEHGIKENDKVEIVIIKQEK